VFATTCRANARLTRVYPLAFLICFLRMALPGSACYSSAGTAASARRLSSAAHQTLLFLRPSHSRRFHLGFREKIEHALDDVVQNLLKHSTPVDEFNAFRPKTPQSKSRREPYPQSYQPDGLSRPLLWTLAGNVRISSYPPPGGHSREEKTNGIQEESGQENSKGQKVKSGQAPVFEFLWKSTNEADRI
jgi:hypothetical protein